MAKKLITLATALMLGAVALSGCAEQTPSPSVAATLPSTHDPAAAASASAAAALTAWQEAEADAQASSKALASAQAQASAEAAERKRARATARAAKRAKAKAAAEARTKAAAQAARDRAAESESCAGDGGDGYVNSDGVWIPSPSCSDDGSVPAGASAQCDDGTYSYSTHRSGTCSGHGGVAVWL